MSEVSFVLDASVTVAWVFRETANAYATGVLQELTRKEAVTPSIWPLQVANALLTAQHKGRLTVPECEYFLSLLSQLPIHVEYETPEHIWDQVLSLAQHYHLTVYEATYLDLAMRLARPLATQAPALRQAAQELGLFYEPLQPSDHNRPSPS